MKYYRNICAISMLLTASLSYAENKIVSVKNIQEFDRLLSNTSQSTVVLFHSGCPVCRVTKGHFTDMTSKYPTDVVYVEVNITIVPELAAKYDITSLPTVLIFKVGSLEPTERLVGPNGETLSSAINTVLQAH